MKLDGDRIIIESRTEINKLIAMVDMYVESGECDEDGMEELARLSKQLRVLYMEW